MSSVPKGVKVGSAWIDITPVMDQAELSRELEKFESAVKTEYKRASDITQAYARLRVELEKWVTAKFGDQAKGRLALAEQTLKAQTALQKTESAQILKALDGVEKAELASERRKTAAKQAAARRKERIALNARDLEIKYGQQVADDYLAQIKTMQKGKQKLTLTQINETKRWAELEQAEIRKVAAADREAQRNAIRNAQVTAAKKTEAAKQAQAAYTRTFETVRSQELQTMELDKMRTRARIEGELAVRQAALDTATTQLTAAKSSLAGLATASAKTSLSVADSFKKAGDSIHKVGTTATELGRTMLHVVTPMAAVGAGLTAWGLKAADNFQNAQTSLKSMGMALQDANDLMNNLTKYGLKTPYSVGDMLTYGTRFSRAIGAHNADFTSSDPKRHAKGSADVSSEAQNIVQMIGDLAARGGITDSSMVQRGYYAMEKLMDADRVSLRDTKQLEYAVNMPVQELAQLLGFKNDKYTKKQVQKFKKVNPGFHAKAGDIYPASAQMMEVMANAKTTGGVRGQDMVSNLLKYWEGKSNVPGAKPDKSIMGSAERLGTSTFSSRLSNMKEGAQQNLRKMFQTFNPKTGELEYTGLGATIMGKKVVDNRKYIQDGVGKGGVEKYKKNPNYGKSHWQGGLLNGTQDVISNLMGKNGKGPIPDLLKGFVDGLTGFVKQLKTWSDFLAKHPEIMSAVKSIAKVIVKVAPWLLMIGTAGKLFGGLFKLMSPVTKGLKGISKGLLGTGKFAMQGVAALIGHREEGETRRDRFRSARASLNNGDDRNGFQKIKDRITGRNSQTERLNLDISKYQEEMNKAKAEIDDFKKKIKDLNKENLNRLAGEAAGKDSSVQDAMQKAEKAAKKAQKATQKLNDEKLEALKGQITGAKTATGHLGTSTGNVSSAVKKLNGKSLKDLRDWFKKLTKAADDSLTKVSALTTQVHDLNGKKTDSVVKEIHSLKDSLSHAKDEALALNLELDAISKHQGGSGGGGKKKPKKPKGGKLATGGILPGYSPGRDVHRFTSNTAGTLELSGGESIMRPEWTAAMGPGYVNKMNMIARTKGIDGVRKSMKFAGGGVLGKLGLNKLVDMAKNFNIGPDVLGAVGTMSMDHSSRALGGDIQGGVVGAGTSGSHFIGSDMADRFKGIYSFLSKDSWDILKKLPIPDGYSQLIGTIGGMIGPVAGPLAWKDIWKGKGNILERGSKFASDLMNPSSILKAVENLFTGAWDSIKSLVSGAKNLVTDPAGFVTDGIHGMWDLVTSEYDGVIDMVKSMREIWSNPMDYASQVVGDIYDTAKDALPNTKGLFDFSGSHIKAKSPNVDVSKLVDKQLSTPGVGSSVSRWTPQVKMALAQLGLSPSNLALVLHRIGVESGGNPRAINLTDSNAKAGYPSQGLMQTIPQTFKAYAGPYLKRGITDPMASIYAGLNYAVHRYGSGWTKALSGIKGYATGTQGAAKGWAWVGERGPELVRFGGGETVLNHGDSMMAAGKTRRGYASGTGARTTGVAADAEKGVSSLNAAVKRLYEIITKAFTSGRIGSGSANSLNKWLDKENKTLQKIVKDRTDLAPKLKDANSKLAAVKKDESDMAASISDKAVGLRSLTDVFNADGVSSSSALSSLRERLAAIKSFQSDISALVKKGFSKEIISEIAQAGPEQGDAMAKALLQSTSSQVTDINNTYKAIGDASNSLGKSVAGSYYKAGRSAAQSLVDGLTAKDSKLKKQIEGIADTIVKTLKNKLHFNSKTPVIPGLASLLTWLTGESQAVKGSPPKAAKKKTTRVTTSYSTDSKGRKVVTVTTTTSDPASGTTTVETDRTVGNKTTHTSRVTHTKGYWTGTRAASPGFALVGERGPELVKFGGGERVYNAKETAGMTGPKYEIHIHEAKSENTTQSVLRAMQYAEVMAGM
jgi:SLT domain-containing protein